MPFADVLHQRSAQDRLQRTLQANRVPHAYLFAGPDGVGKEMLARRLAAVLLCESPREAPAPTDAGGTTPSWIDACGQCADCVLQAAGNHPDFHHIYRSLNKLHPDSDIRKRKAVELSVGLIRHFLIEKAGLHPSRGRAKVFIISEAHLLSDKAQNALLKTLEEPPERSYLILLTDSLDLLLPTTRSRCQHVAFRRLPSSFIIEQLVTSHGAAPAAARFLAEFSQGSLGAAARGLQVGLFDFLPRVTEAILNAGADPLGCGKRILEVAGALIPALTGRREVEATDEPAEDEPPVEDADAKDDAGEGASTNILRDSRKIALTLAGAVLRDVQRVIVGCAPAALPDHPAIGALARTTTTDAVGRAIRALASAEYQIDSSINVSLIFDTVGIELGRAFAGRASAARK